jgi:hypothetical protein
MDEPKQRREIRDRWFPPPRTRAELQEPAIADDVCFRVRGARIVFADHALLQRDFPALQPAALMARDPALARLSGARRSAAIRRAIDAWLLRHAALMSKTQCDQTLVNEPIPHDPEPIAVYRPPLYGRAVIVPVEGGLLDLKGAGCGPENPPLADRKDQFKIDGILHLCEAFKEYLHQRVLGCAFRVAEVPWFPLPIYAVLDLPFDSRRGLRAGLVVRRAHARHRWGSDFHHSLGAPEYRTQVLIEMLLRQYALTSARGPICVEISDGKSRFMVASIRDLAGYTIDETRAFLSILAPGGSSVRYQMINIQTTPPVYVDPIVAQLIDFEAFWGIDTADYFADPLMQLVGDRVHRWGGALPHDHPDAPKIPPHPKRKRWVELMGVWPRTHERERRIADAKTDDASHIFCHELAQRVASGRLSVKGACRALDRRIAELHALLKQIPGPPPKDRLAKARRAAQALFRSGATTGTRLLDADRDQYKARLFDAVECQGAREQIEVALAPERTERDWALDFHVLRVLSSKDYLHALAELEQLSGQDAAAKSAADAARLLAEVEGQSLDDLRNVWKAFTAHPRIGRTQQLQQQRIDLHLEARKAGKSAAVNAAAGEAQSA